jgi:hypothetical protein
MSTYGLLFERKESGAPQGAGNVVTVKSGSAIKSNHWDGNPAWSPLLAGWVVHG